MDRALRWLVRAAWALFPVAAGPALAAALDGRSEPVQAVASVGLWAGWAAALVATLAAHPISLTAVRLAAPASLGAVLWAATTGEASVAAAGGAAAHAALVIVLITAPGTAVWLVNGPAYPNERRFPLRTPGALLAGPVWVAGAAVIALPVAAALVLAAGQLVVGTVFAITAVPVVGVLARALHGLSRRWLVFVPAGIVIHDPMALADPVLFPKEMIASVGPAPATSEATDLTLRAPGLALELRMRAPAAIVRAARRSTALDQELVEAVLVMPARPGVVMREVEGRGLPVLSPPLERAAEREPDGHTHRAQHDEADEG